MEEYGRILHLALKARWYDMIESGEKTEEYREIKPYWVKRLVWDADYGVPVLHEDIEFICSRPKGIENLFDAGWKPRTYTHVCFRYGYTKRTMLFPIKEITIGRGNPAWGAPEDRDVFIIKLNK